MKWPDRAGPPWQGKQFFIEKKNQKTFAYKAYALPQRVRQLLKVFGSFFKKNCFLTGADYKYGSNNRTAASLKRPGKDRASRSSCVNAAPRFAFMKADKAAAKAMS